MAYKTGILSDLLREEKKKIYCFGAGRMFDDFLKEFSNYKLKENIIAIVDNQADWMSFSSKVVQGTNIPIISFETMIKNVNASDRVIITTAAYEEIVEQLTNSKEIDEIDYYIYPILRIEQYDDDRLNINIPSRLSTYKCIQIPKTIHYCWFGGKDMPIQYIKWMEGWKQYCPDYEIVEWNEKNYNVHKNKYISQAYDMEQWAFVSDYARIDIVNECGGIYLDVDVELKKNLDELLMNYAFCGFETSKYVNYGLGFGAQRNNILLKEIKEYYENGQFIYSDGTFNQRSCPLIQTEIMKRHGIKCNGEFQIVDGMVVYPSRVLCGMSPHSFRIERDITYTYAIHHFSGSWVGNKEGKNKLILTMKKWSRNDNYIYPNL